MHWGKVTSFGRSAILSHPLTFNFPWSLGYTRKLAFESPLEENIQSRFYVQPTYCAQEYQTCTYTVILGYQFTLASEIHFSCPEKFTLGQCRIRTTDLSIALPLDQRAPTKDWGELFYIIH